MRARSFLPVAMVVACVAAASCSTPDATRVPPPDVAIPPAERPVQPQTPQTPEALPGMPPPAAPDDIYAATRPGMLSPAMDGVRELVYVPNSKDNTVSVIDPHTFKVIDTFPAGDEPQHVVPSYDLRTLYVAADKTPGNSGLIPVDPKTGKPTGRINVHDPYNLYFTPDGKSAIVVAEAYQRLDFYDPHTWQPQGQLRIPECGGINHMDFTVDGKVALVSCEFSNKMVAVDFEKRTHVRTFDLHQHHHGMPQDSRLSPDGKTFYVADMMAGGVYLFDGQATHQIGFIPTGRGAHGIYFSRDSKRAFITNRDEGSVTVLDLATNKSVATWRIPGGGSPDMGALSPDGGQLWLSGRYHREVYVFDTTTGALVARIPVGDGPHGLDYFPQPGRYSLGHTSNIR